MFRCISIEEATIGMRLGKNIYNENGNLLLSAGVLLQENYIKKLKRKGFSAIFVGEIPSDIEIPEIVSEKVRLRAIRTIRDSIGSIKSNGKLDLKRLSRVVDLIVDEILQEKDLIINLLDLRSIGDYTYRHSVNVCILSIIIARSLFYSRDQLKNLGVGAILHDIGKAMISENILNKKDTLTNEEFKEIKKHSRYGYEILGKFKNINLLSKHIAYQHHERVDGSGYPRELTSDDMIEFAKIVSIVDVFDAMTSNRVYRDACLPSEAIKQIAKTDREKFDSKLIKIFMRSIAPYPVGVKVQLNNGLEGIVTKINSEAIDRPVITITEKSNIGPYDKEYLTDFRLDLCIDDSLEIISSTIKKN